MINIDKSNKKYKREKKKDKKYKQESKDKEQNIVSKEILIESCKKSFKINYIFYISLLVSCIILSLKKKESFLGYIWSLIMVSSLGYFYHYVSHKLSATDYFMNSNNIFKHIPITNVIGKKICNIIDFHHDIHHDTNINKQPINIFYEFMNNFLSQGLNAFILIKIARSLNERACFIWGLLYATVHNINYMIWPPSTHRDHHIDNKTNFGIDIYDIIFGTKYDWDDIENINHYSFNLIIISLIFSVL
tara:strand:+ start:1362 stop:2102 length:741 start_codon:yes stop_codon:yes gene_type:complete